MPATAILERFTGRRIFAFQPVDHFAASMGTLGPRPPILGMVRFLITERTDLARKYEPPRRLQVFTSSSGNYLTDGTMLPAREGERPVPLALGTYQLRVEGDLYQTAEREITWPPAGPISVDLFPSQAYPTPDPTSNPPCIGLTVIRGCLFHPATGAPVANADVSVAPDSGPPLPGPWKLAKSKTSAQGEWMLVLPNHFLPQPMPTATVRFTLDGLDLVTELQVGRENLLTQPSLRGVALNETGSGFGGVKVSNDVQAGVATTDINGRWVTYFPIDQESTTCNLQAANPAGEVRTRQVNVRKHTAVMVERFQF